jgi:hypothetical protein
MSYFSENVFASNYFADGFFGPYKAAPTPVIQAVAGMGGGGGFSVTHEKGMRRKKKLLPAHAKLSSFVEKIAPDIATLTMEGLKKSTHANPLKTVKEIPEKVIRDGMIRTLRARITELEAQIRRLKTAHGAELEGALADLERTQMLAVAVLERVEAAEGRLAEIRPIEVHVTLAAPPEETSGWTILLGAAAVLLATETLIPPREKAWKEAGRGLAGVMALYGVAKVL